MNKGKKIDFTINENNCFICSSHRKNDSGYAMMKVNKKNIRIHRHIYEECFGEIPEGMVIRHKCDNPSCINPEHLELGAQGDNIRDSIERGRRNFQGAKGERNTKAKLTKEQVLKIRQKYSNGEKPRNLIKEYDVKETALYDILARRSWKHI